MPKSYRVFLGAPPITELQNDPISYSWRTFSSSEHNSNSASSGALSAKSTHPAIEGNLLLNQSSEGPLVTLENVAVPSHSRFTQSDSVILPIELLEAASERISMIYRDCIFGEDNGDEENAETIFLEDERLVEGADFTPDLEDTKSKEETDPSIFKLNETFEAPSFIRTTPSPSSPKPSGSFSKTQDDPTTQPESQSFGPHSWTSSIARFPSFHFSLHALSSLSSLSAQASNNRTTSHKGRTGKFARKINLLLAVLEVEGPDTITIKNGVDAGKEVGILKMILGDDDSEVCKLTAWREVAEEWGGCGKSIGAKRGDVIYIKNVLATCEPATSITLSASTFLKSTLTICYRTMPYTPEDGSRLRPDLRLGISEPCVRKVAYVVRWFEQMAGLG